MTTKKRLLMAELDGCSGCTFGYYLGHSGAYKCQHEDNKHRDHESGRSDRFPDHCPLPQIEPEEPQ